MDNKELIKIAYDMGAHPYSVGGMVTALQKGIDIDLIPQILDHWWMIDGDKPTWEEYANKALK